MNPNVGTNDQRWYQRWYEVWYKVSPSIAQVRYWISYRVHPNYRSTYERYRSRTLNQPVVISKIEIKYRTNSSIVLTTTPPRRAHFEASVRRHGTPVVRVVNRKSGGRHIENLDALVNALRGRGIEVEETDPGGQGAPGLQMAMMSQTDVMVAPHGAGLTNAFAMPPCGAVIELYPHR